MTRELFLTREDIRRLIRYTSPQGVLSIYLEAGPTPASGGWSPTVLRSGLRKLLQEHGSDKVLEEVAEKATDEILGLPPETRRRSLAYFRDAEGELVWWRSLRGAVPTRFVWRPGPFVRPLVAYLDDCPRVGILILSQEEARMLTWRQGYVLEESERHLKPSVTPMRPEGPPQGEPTRGPHAASPVDRLKDRVSHHVRRFAHEVARALPKVAVEEEWERLVLIGPSPLRAELQAHLKEPWRDLVIGSADKVLLHAGVGEIAETVDPMITAWNRERERKGLAEVLEQAGSGGRAVVGPEPCLQMLQQGRVDHLYFASDLNLTGWRRPDGTLTVTSDGAEDAKKEPHLVEAMIALAFETGADVTPVEGDVARELMELGGTAARLRY
jgi:protein required for attachment to host cells